MNEMIEFLTSKEIIVVYIIIAIAFFICFIIYLIDKSSEKRRRKQNTKKLNRLVEDVNNRLAEEEIKEEKKKKKKVVEDEVDRITKPNVSTYQNTPSIKTNKFVEPEVNYLPPEVDFVPPIGEKEEEVIPVANINEPLVQTPPSRTKLDTNQNNSIYTGYNKVQDNAQVEVPTLTSSSNYDGFDYGYNTKSNVNNYIVDEVTQSFNNEMDAQINRVHEKIDELIYTDPEPDREEATRELIRLTEELEKAEKAQRQGINIEAYESRQEEDAIISLDELKKRGEAMYASNETTQYADEGDEPITLEDLERRKRSAYGVEVEDPIIEESIESVRKEPVKSANNSHAYQERKKGNDEIFSSVFGTGNTSSARTREEIDEELQKTSEFLLSLKDLQSKLNS